VQRADYPAKQPVLQRNIRAVASARRATP